ncbi:metallophosphoesterase family protein [Alkalihalobacillus sp. 1P02AB]|uniref:metallophosphoesterase family protein n=1 Tax=Alkalihalobacillus sp. 1P02AB TaxID=3132260 RepID=UPI0039A4E9A0
MKFLILSDSHSWQGELKPIIDRHKEEVDYMIHCGDSELQGTDAVLKDMIVVRGNCDYGEDFPEEVLEQLGPVKLYVTHGHLYNVKMTATNLTYRAEEVGAELVCFGHSHIATAFAENGIVYINPGSIRLPFRPARTQTYVICEVDEANIRVTFHTIDGAEYPELSEQFERVVKG